MLSRTLLLASMLCLAACTVTSSDNTDSAATVSAVGELPVRPGLRDYRLDNGLRVLLLPRPEPGVELRLLVATGSMQETAQQRGLAHFVEHMAFKGTRHFPGQAGLQALEREGISLGPDINAATRFNSTLYKLSLPDGQTDLALRVMADWAGQVSFDPAAFEAEREVIVEEWRLRQGVGQRINQQLERLRYADSDYARRDPIGDLAIIRHAPLEQAVAFYRDGYQPQRMTLVLVGSFDEGKVREAIDQAFATQPRGQAVNPAAPRFHGDTTLRVAQVFDGEQGQRLLQFALQRDLPASLDTQNGQWRDLIDALWLGVLDERLDLLVEQGGFASAGTAERSSLLDARRAQYLFMASLRDDDLPGAAERLLSEVRRLAVQPVTASELASAKRRLLEKLQGQAAGQQRYGHAVLADGLADALEYRMPMFDKRQQLALTEAWLPRIGVDHLRAAVAELLQQASPRLAVIGPDSDAGRFDDARFQAVWQRVQASQLERFALQAETQELALAAPASGRLDDLPDLAEVGAQQWRLGNGIRVIVKTDPSLQDNVRLELRQAGGSSLEPDDQAGQQHWAIQLAERSGYGAYSPRQLTRLGDRHGVRVQPFSDSLFHGLRGTAPADQLETLFKLLNLKLTAARFDAAPLAQMRQSMAEGLRHQPAERRYMDAINRDAYANGQRMVSDAQGPWRHFDVAQLARVHGELFSVRPGMTLVIAGPADLTQLRALTRTWVAGLPLADSVRPHWQDRGVRPLHRVMDETYPWSSSPKSMVSVLYSSPAQWRGDDVLALQLLDQVASLRLRQAIREQASGVYAIGFSQLLTRLPSSYYLARLNFTAAPERAEALAAQARDVIQRIADAGISAGELQQARQALLNDQRQQRRSALYWSEALLQVAMVDDDFASLASEPERLRALDLQTVNRLAAQWLGRNPKQFVLAPQVAGPQG
ncbi:insulinase family protein [Pseudomonas sp. GD03858]|uniref:M16 family metallopeptidase n=1 Tax=unclassified Pseudomonas TaxID=196821 RepID=UPI00244A735D|nr:MULTISPECIES: M16 family metallopeptidase [unclassified Pseudomonas]MDH0645724.1 insulinase family protein [Pseudomonas sp. GD03867]MDH0661169.1 insulinase family protein [Pseudomonas sp. GD03858]